MIGKIMSEAAHSIIGMFSARPLNMENSPSNSDFRSLLQSTEDEPRSTAVASELETADIKNIASEETDADAAQHWGTTNVLPFINQSTGSMIFNQVRSSEEIGEDSIEVDPVDVGTPEEKLSVMLTQDLLSGSDGLQSISAPVASVNAESSAVAARHSPDLLSSKANVVLGNGSQTVMASTTSTPDVVDGQPVNETLLKLKNIQQQMRGETGERPMPASKAALSSDFEDLEVPFNDQANKLELDKQTAALSPLMVKRPEAKDGRSELGQFGFRSSQREAAPVPATSLQNTSIADGEFMDTAKSDILPPVKAIEPSMVQMPVANSTAQLAARETLQKPASFDMSSPQIAERLGAEIADISLAGGAKKFEINPRNLGRMEIVFTTRGSTEIIEIQTEHRAAKDIIVQHSQVLQDILKAQGRDDLTLRVDVKENVFSSSRNDGGNFSQQENRDAREQQARPSQNRPTAQSFDNSAEIDTPSDQSRYA